MITSRELTLPAGLVTFDRDCLKFLRKPTWEEWQQLADYAVACRKASLRWLADVFREGRKDFGDEAVANYERQLALQFPEVKAAAALELLEVRLPEVSDEVHLKIGKMVSNPAERLWWLEIAERENLSAREAMWSIAKTPAGASVPVIVREGDTGRKAGVLTVEGIMAEFDIWRKKVDLGAMDAETLGRLVAQLKPAWEIYQEAAEREFMLRRDGEVAT